MWDEGQSLALPASRPPQPVSRRWQEEGRISEVITPPIIQHDTQGSADAFGGCHSIQCVAMNTDTDRDAKLHLFS